MTDVAAVSGHASAKAGSGAAKGGAAKGSGSVLEGAFAALFGAAGGKNAGNGSVGTNIKPEAQAKPGAQTLDPALTGETVTAEVDPQAVLTDAGVKLDVAEQPEAGTKPRKTGTQRKTDASQAEAQAISLMGAFAAVVTNVSQGAQAPQGKQPTISVDGVQSLKTAAPIAAEVAAAVTTNIMTKPGTDSSKTDNGKTNAGKDTKAVAVADAQPQTTTASTDNITVAGQQNDQASDSRNGCGNGNHKDQDPPASPQLADNDGSVPTVATGSLQDIMQSLPPVLQSQLGVVDLTGAPAVPTISTGDQLSNQAIDMNVSGQWIDRMAREIATLASGTGHSSFQLNPPNLGKIQVDLLQSGDKTNVRILTETDEATQRLRDGQSALEANARMASLSLGSVSVQKSPTPSDSSRDQSQRQSPDSGNSQQQQQASAQAQGQSGQNRGGAGFNRGGFAAVMGQEQGAVAELAAGVDRASDPGVRFA